jgi:hypothetical protein
MTGQHAITIFNDAIYDSSTRYPLKKTIDALNWCVGGGEPDIICIGTNRIFQLLPKHISGEVDEQSIPKLWKYPDGRKGWISGTKKGKIKVLLSDGGCKLYKHADDLYKATVLKNQDFISIPQFKITEITGGTEHQDVIHKNAITHQKSNQNDTAITQTSYMFTPN